jgi:hypothetical protein
MRKFSVRPTSTLRGRKLNGLRGWSGEPTHPPLTVNAYRTRPHPSIAILTFSIVTAVLVSDSPTFLVACAGRAVQRRCGRCIRDGARGVTR